MSEETMLTEGENSDTDTSTETDENEELDESSDDDQESEDDESYDDDDQEDDEESAPQKPKKDYKKAFNSVMSNNRKLQRENDLLKSKSGGKKVSDDDLADLREKYEEDDLEVIQKIIDKKLKSHDAGKLEQREENIFLKNHPETTDAQLKHIKFMQNEFGYSLKYAYEITFWGAKAAKQAPKNHSISGWQGTWPAPAKKDDSDEQAYNDMKKFYGA